MTEIVELPARVQAAVRTLRDVQAFYVLLEWLLEEHGFAKFGELGKDRFEEPQYRKGLQDSALFMAELAGLRIKTELTRNEQHPEK